MQRPSVIIVGLGNPGREYAHTRHNVGFRVLDTLAALRKARFTAVKKYEAEIAELPETPRGRVLLVKPQTFMNVSGRSVAALATFFDVDPLDIWVVQDDLDMPVGSLRLKLGGGGSGGHNGIKSLEQSLGSNDFVRLKIGVRPDFADQKDAKDVVLGVFSKQEEEFLLPNVIGGAVLALENMLEEGPERTLSKMGTFGEKAENR